MVHFNDHVHPWPRHVIDHYPTPALAAIHDQLCDAVNGGLLTISQHVSMDETIERIEDCLSGRHYTLLVLYGVAKQGFVPQRPTPQINILYQEPSGINVRLGQTPNGQLALTAPDTAGTSKFNADTAGAKTMRRHINKLEEKYENEALDETREEDRTAEKLRLLDLEADRDRRKDKLMQEKLLAANKEREIRDMYRREKDEMKEDFQRTRARSKERNRKAADEERDRKEDERRRERGNERRKRELESQERQAKREKEKREAEAHRQAEERRHLRIENRPSRPAIEYPGATFANRRAPITSVGQQSAALDLYAAIGLNRADTPTTTVINQAWRRSMLRHHPDKDAGKTREDVERSRNRMREVNLAKDVLLDEKRRQAYDERGITTLEGFREWQFKRQYVRK